MKFVKAKIENITTIQELARKSWEVAYKGIISDEQIEYMLGTMYSKEELSRQIDENANYHYFLISDDEDFVGFIGYENHHEPKTTKLHRIYLVPEAKGKGFGKAGINFLKERVAECGDNRIILNVNKANPAQHVYLSQGFKVYKEIVLDIGNGFVMDDFLMELLI